ncbi:MAG: hypothetical protein ABEJ93_02930 [Candidatus Nanohalobium sp.]
MIAGLILKKTIEEESKIAFLKDEETVISSVSTNQDLVEEIGKHSPEVIAVDVGMKQGPEEYTEEEEELREEGHVFTPNSHQEKTVERLKALEKHLQHSKGLQPDFIRFEPQITAKELAIDGDQALESLGVETESIGSAEEFDAVLGAVTARFYQEGQSTEKGVVVPESMREETDEGLERKTL